MRGKTITAVHRSASTDSYLSLDGTMQACHVRDMDHTHGTLYLERRDSSKNMLRFYKLSVGHDLFGEIVLVRSWGRIGTRGQSKMAVFVSQAEAGAELNKLYRRKSKRGYWIAASSEQGELDPPR